MQVVAPLTLSQYIKHKGSFDREWSTATLPTRFSLNVSPHRMEHESTISGRCMGSPHVPLCNATHLVERNLMRVLTTHSALHPCNAGKVQASVLWTYAPTPQKALEGWVVNQTPQSCFWLWCGWPQYLGHPSSPTLQVASQTGFGRCHGFLHQLPDVQEHFHSVRPTWQKTVDNTHSGDLATQHPCIEAKVTNQQLSAQNSWPCENTPRTGRHWKWPISIEPSIGHVTAPDHPEQHAQILHRKWVQKAPRGASRDIPEC